MASHQLGTCDEWLTARVDLLHRAPLGRDEGDRSWFQRHDEYPSTTAGLS